MARSTIGLLHPGEMGSALGSALVGRGHRVLWSSEGRSEETRMRAHEAELEDVRSLGELLAGSDVVLCVCPPHAARDVADSAGGFNGLYVDANAVAPATARAIGESLECAFVD